MKSNFQIKKPQKQKSIAPKDEISGKKISQEELEEFIHKSGAAGSFMIFRSKNKKNELGMDNL